MSAQGKRRSDVPCEPDGAKHIQPLLLSAEQLGMLLGVSRSTIWTGHNGGKIPLPLKIRGTTRRRRNEIEEWIEAGAPGREKWMAALRG